MIEVIFLIVLGIIWTVFASIQDLRKREVNNWLNFSLVIFGLGFKFFYSLFEWNFSFFYWGITFFVVFFVLSNLFYYSRLFAGGDAKLMIAFGAILPFSENFYFNIRLSVMFLFIFFLVGFFYGTFYSFVLAIKNWKSFSRGFLIYLKKYEKVYILTLIFVLFFILLGIFFNFNFILLSLVFLFLFYLLIYSKTVDIYCMVKKVSPELLTEGDWLYKKIRVGKKEIVPHWEGLENSDIEILRKVGKEVYIREGIPFVPVFLISFLILIYLYFNNLIFVF